MTHPKSIRRHWRRPTPIEWVGSLLGWARSILIFSPAPLSSLVTLGLIGPGLAVLSLPAMSLRRLTLAQLTLRGERAFRSIHGYAELKQMLVADRFLFRAPNEGSPHAHYDRVLFLNLSFWHAGEGNDVLVDDSIDADVVAHAAWHHAAGKALATGRAPTAAAMFLGESIASAFDLYVVGRMLGTGKRTAYLASQVPLLSEAALSSGLTEAALAALFQRVSDAPEVSFEALRELLFDAAMALSSCRDAEEAVGCFDRFAAHPYSPFLHHFALATWVLYARAHAGPAVADDPAAAADRALRAAPAPLTWLIETWVKGEAG